MKTVIAVSVGVILALALSAAIGELYGRILGQTDAAVILSMLTGVMFGLIGFWSGVFIGQAWEDKARGY